MLRQVINPGGKAVLFSYDPLGRRIAKTFKNQVTRWVWDGNVPLHEWKYEGGYPPQNSIDENGEILETKEPIENLITWVFEDGSFVPCAKIENEIEYSIVADYLGTPTHAYDSNGEKVWEREIDCYGKVRRLAGEKTFCPYLYQGQSVDEETGLAYNRFRYYDSESGGYLSQDPIGLLGGNPTVYGYVADTNNWVDPGGLGPVTNTVDFTGHSDLFPHENSAVKIKLTGDRDSDFTRAFKESGIKKTDASGYTWHHVADFNPTTGESTMQLVKRATHEANLPHKGSAGQFADHFGVEYDTFEAKMKAHEQGWRNEPKQRAPASHTH
jgi:RHS repeat-associated protein